MTRTMSVYVRQACASLLSAFGMLRVIQISGLLCIKGAVMSQLLL